MLKRKGDSMRKFITGCALFLTMIASCTVLFAEEIPYKVVCDYANNAVKITGNIDSECEYITLQILKDGYTFSQYDANGNQSYILWRGQAETENGSYLFKVGYPEDMEGKGYEARLVTDKKYEKTVINSLMLVNKTEYVEAVDKLNELASGSDYGAFKEFVETEGCKVGFDLTLLSKLSGDNKLKAYYEYVGENHLDADKNKQNSKTFNTFVLMEGLAQRKISNINNYIENTVLTDLAIYEDYKVYASTKNEQEYLTSKMQGIDMDSVEELEANLKSAILLEEIYNASGYGDVRDIMRAYGSVAGISGTASDAVYKKMTGKDYENISALTKDYEKLCEDSKNSGGSSGGGGGSGGSSSKGDVKVQIEAGIITSDGSTVSKKNASFEDIDGIDWATEAILALADKGILNGKSEGYFYPNDNITREEFAKIMVIALGYENEKASLNNFADVKTNDWFADYVNIAYEKNILKGIGDGKFGTGMPITRQDMCVMINNAFSARGKALESAELSFSDAYMIAPYAYDAVSALYGAGIINGVSETEINPMGNASRAQAAKIVYGMIKQF